MPKSSSNGRLSSRNPTTPPRRRLPTHSAPPNSPTAPSSSISRISLVTQRITATVVAAVARPIAKADAALLTDEVMADIIVRTSPMTERPWAGPLQRKGQRRHGSAPCGRGDSLCPKQERTSGQDTVGMWKRCMQATLFGLSPGLGSRTCVLPGLANLGCRSTVEPTEEGLIEGHNIPMLTVST